MAKKKLELGRQYRAFNLTRENINEEDRTVELSYSSEYPVKRYWGHEILSHTAGDCDLTRLSNSGAFLMDHLLRDQRGVVEKAWIENGKGRAIVRLSKNERGEELYQDMKDQIRTKISVGYDLVELLDAWDEDGEEYYRFKWAPYEISSVSVEADVTVGIGRSDESGDKTVFEFEMRGKNMAGEDKGGEKAPEQRTKAPVKAPAKAPADNGGTDTVRDAETVRCQEIMAMGSQFGMGDEAMRAIGEKASVDSFRQVVLDSVREKKAKPAGTEMNLGLSDGDVKRYSLINAVRASITGNWKDAGFEREVSVALADKMGKDARGFYVNYEVLANLGRAAQSTGVGVGGELVSTELWSNEFIDLLRPNSIAAGLGVRFATGLVGNVDIPKMTSGSSFYWIDEDADGTDSNVGLGVVKMSPKTIAGAVPITRRLMQQSTPDIDLLIRDDMLRGVGLGIDKAVFLGTGVGAEPKGIKNHTGVNAIPVPPGGWDWATIVAFETAVAEANGRAESMAYAMRPSMRGTLKTTEKVANTAKFLWEDNMVNGYKGEISTQLETDAMLMGDFSQALVGMWGALDLTVDKSTKAASGGTVLRVFQDADVAVRQAPAFAYGKKA